MINPESINLAALPSVSLSERSQLPSASCIYFAIDGQDVIQYIGRAVNARTRWSQHHRKNDLEKIGGIRIAYLAVTDVDLLDQIEFALIRYFRPRLNSVRVPCASMCRMGDTNIYLALSGIRKQKKVSLNALSRMTGLSPQYLARLEKGTQGNPTLDTINLLCRSLRVKPGELLDYVDDDEV